MEAYCANPLCLFNEVLPLWTGLHICWSLCHVMWCWFGELQTNKHDLLSYWNSSFVQIEMKQCQKRRKETFKDVFKMISKKSMRRDKFEEILGNLNWDPPIYTVLHHLICAFFPANWYVWLSLIISQHKQLMSRSTCSSWNWCRLCQWTPSLWQLVSSCTALHYCSIPALCSE